MALSSHTWPDSAGERPGLAYRETQRRGELPAILAGISRLLTNNAEPQAVMEAVVQATARLLGVQAVALWLHDASADILRLRARVPALGAGGELTIPVDGSLSGWVLRSGQPFVTHQLTEHPLWQPMLPFFDPPASGVFVPFSYREHPLGVLVALSTRERPFAHQDVELVEVLAAQVAIAIRNAGLYEDAWRQARQLATILVVNKRLALGPELEEILSIITEEAARLLRIETAGLRLLEGDELVRAASYGPAEAIMVRERLPIGESLSGRVAKEDRALSSTNLTEDLRHDPAHQAPARAYGFHAWLGVPLRGREGVVGVLFVADRGERSFEQADIRMLEAFADQAAIAIDNARLYRELGEREGRLRELVGRLLLAQEEERRRVAYEVHDGLAQFAAAGQQHLEAFASHYRPRSPRTQQELQRALDLAQRTVREARQVIADLRPAALDDFGLPTALRLEADALRAEGWRISFEQRLGSRRLPPMIETALFRVAQEALTNVRKHARTTRVLLRLERRARIVCLQVRDWGRGFQPAAVLASSGPSERVGLLGMQERIAWLGGRCTVRSRPGAGTRIVAEVPLPAPAEMPSDNVSGVG